MLNRLHDALRLRTSPVIFFSSAAVIIAFVLGTILFTEPLDRAVSGASEWLLTNLGWFYILGVTMFLAFLLFIDVGRFGRVKLGPDDEPPEHSGGAWFAMLFAAGIGSILMFWGVAEPVSHFGDPPRGTELGIEAGTWAAAKDAMNFTYYHFTLHTWTIFTLPALCFAYFIHKRNLPPRVSSIFQPILGEGIHGPVGKFIDVVAIIGTVFGIAVSISLGTLQINGGLNQLFGVPGNAGRNLIVIGVACGLALISVCLGLGERTHGPVGTHIGAVAIMGTGFGIAVSIGLGTLQINGGLNQLFGVPENAGWNLIIIGVVCGLALISVSLGLEKGIKVLSNFNIVAAVLLMLFVLVAGGSTLFILKGTFESFGSYLVNLPELALWNDTYANSGWQNTWTVFYWAWTITWSPFVGIFIARISKGRTIRQFVSGVLAIPAGFSVIWFGVFGLASVNIELNQDGGLVDRVVDEGDVPGALFVFLDHYPAALIVSVIAIILVIIFFVTSVDSAALVTDSMANGHEDFNPSGQRLFWGGASALLTATLLVFSGEGGLTALQSTIILVGLPFFVMGYFLMYALLRALKEDAGELPPVRTREWAQVLPPEEFERREEDEEFDTEEYVVEPTYTSEIPVLRDPYEEDREGENGVITPVPRHPPARTGTPRPPLPEDGRPQGR